MPSELTITNLYGKLKDKMVKSRINSEIFNFLSNAEAPPPGS